jgi:hypothetical protein
MGEVPVKRSLDVSGNTSTSVQCHNPTGRMLQGVSGNDTTHDPLFSYYWPEMLAVMASNATNHPTQCNYSWPEMLVVVARDATRCGRPCYKTWCAMLPVTKRSVVPAFRQATLLVGDAGSLCRDAKTHGRSAYTRSDPCC